METTVWTPEKRVRIAAENARNAREHLEVQIRDAREKGVTLRAIAEVAGMSYETVRRICA